MWFILSASPWEHGHWGWRRDLYEVHAEVRPAWRDNSVDGERLHPQCLVPWKMSHLFPRVCRTALGKGWTEPKRQQERPTFPSLSTSSDPPRPCSGDIPEALLQQARGAIATTWELGTEQGGIHLLGTGKSATATFEFISKSTFVLSVEQLI